MRGLYLKGRREEKKNNWPASPTLLSSERGALGSNPAKMQQFRKVAC
jgi:hypothetical protein